MTTKVVVVVAASAAVAAALSALIVLTVHSVLLAQIGPVPVALGLWVLFGAGAWLVFRLPGRPAAGLVPRSVPVGGPRPALRFSGDAAGRLDRARGPRVHQDQPAHRAHHL